MTERSVILVGCGNAGSAHARAIREHGGFSLAAVCDPRPTARSSAKAEAQAPGAEELDDWRDAFKRRPRRGEVVVVATPPDTHAEIAISALQSGRPTLCEKPMASTLEQAREMADVARETGLLLADCSSRYVLAPAIGFARETIARGELGTVYRMALRCRLPRLRLGIDAQVSQTANFLSRAAYGGGSLMDPGVYLMPVIFRVLPIPRAVTVSGAFAVQLETAWRPAQGVVYDVESAGGGTFTLEYSDRPPVVVDWQSATCAHDDQEILARVEGTRGTLSWSPWPAILFDHDAAFDVRHHLDRGNLVESRILPFPKQTVESGALSHSTGVALDLFARDLDAGVASDGEACGVTAAEALRNFELIHAIYRLAGTAGCERIPFA